MSCGYLQSVDQKQWNDNAQDLATKLRVKILIANGQPEMQQDNHWKFRLADNGKQTGWSEFVPK